jgi:dTDP-4-dehydrorhamnose 3,5-epimerase
MRFLPTDLPGVVVVEPDVHRDGRGYFLEVYHAAKYREAGIPEAFVQDNESLSTRGTLRGLHAQLRRPQGKLVRVLEGEIFDVAADVRVGSPSFGKWTGLRLSAGDFRQMYIPPGFVHGFCVLSAAARVAYKCTELYDSADEYGVVFDDPDLAVDWPVQAPILSEKDRKNPTLAQLHGRLPAYRRR